MTDNRGEQLRAVAEQLAAEAAAFVRSRRAEIFGDGDDPIGSDSVQTKSTPTDPVTVVDTETELLLRDRLATLRPGDAILGEEGGGTAAGDAGTVCWAIDPIDGTVNFVYGIPAYAISIAAQIDGVSVAGAVADVVSGDVYSAASGQGAQVYSDGQRRSLGCSAVTDLSMALVGTGFGYAPRRRAEQAALLAQLLPQVRDIRRVGSAALDLCMVAAGRLDAHYEHGLNVWDWAAGALVASEAGALAVLPPATDSGADGPLTVVAAPGIAGALIEALDRAGGLRPLP
ncbi:inositol monophosphatase family protein [Mycobacterium sp. shizuoka-1]|uniref:inositol monophosphatase family protein n=1 Tax=Mycobacterium sp. shizuoka-1 TaxID=2039281 RepID=UPI000C060892|nr:inositol monophosphatase family protein [Mycobacterium sp. shizuoka-1]GAY16184.1 Inositol-1-monophosphatase [Mycobacterium sp. shizuoka-1]